MKAMSGHVLPFPDGVFFDFDGTLVDSREFLFAAHNHVRDVFGLPHFTQAEFSKMMASTTKEIYARLYAEQDKAAKKVLYAYINENQTAHLKPVDGAEEALISLKQDGILLGIVSNKDQASLDCAVDALGWRRYFAVTVGAGGPIRAKPHADPLFEAMRGAGIPRDRVDRVWMVGDHEADIQCAFNAGSIGILVEYHRDCAEILRLCRPHLVIPEIKNLPDEVKVPVL